MATRLKPSRINVDNEPRVGDGASYKTNDDFHWSMGGGDMSYEDFDRETLTGNSITIQDISNNITPSANFTVSAGSLKPGIEYILRVNVGNTPYTMTLGTGVTNPNGYDTTLKINTVNQFKFIATSDSQIELEGTDTVVFNKIDSKQDTLNAGPGIRIGQYKNYSAMRGPCPDDFHIPSNTEWQTIYDIWIALGGGSTAPNDLGIALKLPYSGYRLYSNASTTGDFTAYYLASTANNAKCYSFHINATAQSISPQFDTNNKASGNSIRPFKDNPIAPTSSWTKLYGTSIESGGIFWSSDLGLISLSSDGANWITIADKNLGATTVWNSGDTLSQENCGNFYQRGNNYGFPRSGTVTTSSTQVDATNYGPGNYYSSSTFITSSSGTHSWDSSNNSNLRGGVTGVVTIENAIINIGVLSVNGETGDVDIDLGNIYGITTTQPINPVAGSVYYDTTNNVIKIYDGTSWITIQNILTAGTGINITNDTISVQDPVLINKSQNVSYGNLTIGGNVLNANRFNCINIGANSYADGPNATQIGQFSHAGEGGLAIGNGSVAGAYSIALLGSTSVRDAIQIGGGTNSTQNTLQVKSFTLLNTTTGKIPDERLNGGVVYLTEPSTPTEGMLWYDTTNNLLKAYNGTSRDAIAIGDMSSKQDKFYSVGTTQPSSASAGDEWYDTTNNVLKIYDGSNWNVADTKYSAGTGIDITSNTIAVTDPVLKNGSYGVTGALSVKGSSGVQGTSVGDTSLATNGTTAVGFYARSDANHAVVIGHGATIISSGKRGIAIGAGATVKSAGSIQLGRGENTEAGSFYVGLSTTPETSSSYVNYKLLDVNGKIPNDRLNGFLVYSNTTAPSSPSEGMLWYDTTNDVLKVYDGTNWNEVGGGGGETYTAGDGIEIKNGLDYSAMRGPCNEGYHIPTRVEMQNLADVMTALGLNDQSGGGSGLGTSWETYLKMPITYGYRNKSGTVISGNNSGRYWTSTPYTTSPGEAYVLFIDSDGGYTQPEYRANGCLIRAFKDDIVIPTNSWATLYDGSSIATGAGIFYNSGSGIISISADGVNWITIADKNVGAAYVYNASKIQTYGWMMAGGRHQRGNDFPFDTHTGSSSTSSTQVDATGYGPGCYYRDYRFIIGNDDWSSVHNHNLWGGVTGIVENNNEITAKSIVNVVDTTSGGKFSVQTSVEILKSENKYGEENTIVKLSGWVGDDIYNLYLRYQGIVQEDSMDVYQGDIHIYSGTIKIRSKIYYADLRFTVDGNGTFGLYNPNTPTYTITALN